MKTLIIKLSILIVLFPFYADAYEKEIKNLTISLGEEISKAGKKTIAVVDFTDLQGNVTELGRFLSEEFSVSLTSSGRKLEVIDRTHLKSILKEHQLALTGVIDPKTARKLGEIVGAQAIVTGAITPFGDSIRFSVKVLDVSTARIICASSADIPKTKAIEELLQKSIESPVDSTSTRPEEPKPPIPGKGIKHVDDKTNTLLEVKSCKLIGDNLFLSLFITNNKGNIRRYTFFPHTSIMDNFGNNYKLGSFRLGSENGPKPNEIFDGGRGAFIEFPPNHSINLFLVFEKISSPPKEIEALMLRYQVIESKIGALPVSEIPLRKISVIKDK